MKKITIKNIYFFITYFREQIKNRLRMGLPGFEPGTNRLSVDHSNQTELQARDFNLLEKNALDQTRTGDLMVNSHTLFIALIIFREPTKLRGHGF